VGFVWRPLACRAVGLLAQTAQTARIKGTIQAEDGSPLAGSNVLIVRTITLPHNSAIITAKDGTFDAPALPAGTYRICTDLRSSEYLSPCTSYAPSAKVTVNTAVKNATDSDIDPLMSFRL